MSMCSTQMVGTLVNPIGAAAPKRGIGQLLDPAGAIGRKVGGPAGQIIDPAGTIRNMGKVEQTPATPAQTQIQPQASKPVTEVFDTTLGTRNQRGKTLLGQ